MQITHCYYPKDLLNQYLYNTPCLIIGLQLNPNAEDYIVVTLLPFDPSKLGLLFNNGILTEYGSGKVMILLNHKTNGQHYEIIDKDKLEVTKNNTSRRKGRKKNYGTLQNANSKNRKGKQRPDNQQIKLDHHDQLTYNVLGFLNSQTSSSKHLKLPMNLIYNNLTKYPISTNIQLNLKIILFDVPDPRVMQFYSIDPIGLEFLESGYSKDNDSVVSPKSNDALRIVDKIKYHGNVGVLNAQEHGFKKLIQALNDCFFYRLYFYNEVLGGGDSSRKIIGLKITKPWEQNFSITRNLRNFRLFLVNHLYILPSYSSNKNNRGQKKQQLVQARKRATSIDYNRQEMLKNYYEERNSRSRCSNKFFKSIDFGIKVIIVYLVIFIRIVIEMLCSALNFRINNGRNLVEISLTAQQIDLRLQQICLIPSQLIKIKQMHNFSDFIRLYNIVWLILNDVLFGFTLGQYVHDKSLIIQDFLVETVIKKLLFKELYKLILWLMNFPAGFKLNSKLAVFFGELFLWIIDFFFSKIVLNRFFVTYGISGFLLAISYGGGIFGATFVISLACDFLNFITLHVYCFYFASAKIFNWLLVILESLFNLFYGKKNNVLKKRTDSADYSLDQLLLGTLLFTITLFIIPTVLAFYLAFTVVSLITLCFMVCLEIVLFCLNHFPIFAMLLRVKDKFRVPGGINFKLLNFINAAQTHVHDLDNSKDSKLNTTVADVLEDNETTTDNDSEDYNDFEDDNGMSYIDSEESEEEEKARSSNFQCNANFNDNGNIIYLELKSVPVSFNKLFYPYILLWNKLKLYYLSPSTLKNLLTGIPINMSRSKLYQLLYLMLPIKPIKTKTLIEALKRNYLHN